MCEVYRYRNRSFYHLEDGSWKYQHRLFNTAWSVRCWIDEELTP